MSNVVERERECEAAARGRAGLSVRKTIQTQYLSNASGLTRLTTRDTSEKVCTSVWHRLFQRSLDVLHVVELRSDLFIRFLTVCSRLLLVESVRLLWKIRRLPLPPSRPPTHPSLPGGLLLRLCFVPDSSLSEQVQEVWKFSNWVTCLICTTRQYADALGPQLLLGVWGICIYPLVQIVSLSLWLLFS